MAKNYTKADLTQLVNEFTAEFDQLVKAEVSKSSGQTLRKSEDGGDKGKESEESSSGSSDSGGSSEGGDKGPPPPASDSGGGGDASAGGPPPADPSSAGGPPGGDPASAGGVPPADPAAGASSGDPVEALKQAYMQLSPEELQSHFFALQQVLQAQMAGGTGGAAPGAPAPGASPAAPPAPGVAGPPAGPDAAAPLAGEGSKPVDPMATMAMKSLKDELDLVKSERDGLKKSLEGLSSTLEKLVATKPQHKAIQATDATALMKSEPKTKTMTTVEIRRKLAVVAANPDLKKSDRSLINKYCVGGVEVDAIAHLLA